jgi:hypothetical protein
MIFQAHPALESLPPFGLISGLEYAIHLEVLLDQVGNPLTRPQRSFITLALGTLQEQLDQAGFLGFIQTGQPSRSARSP